MVLYASLNKEVIEREISLEVKPLLSHNMYLCHNYLFFPEIYDNKNVFACCKKNHKERNTKLNQILNKFGLPA